MLTISWLNHGDYMRSYRYVCVCVCVYVCICIYIPNSICVCVYIHIYEHGSLMFNHSIKNRTDAD